MKNRGWEKNGGGSQILGCMYARGGGVFRCVLCATGGGGGSKNLEKMRMLLMEGPQEMFLKKWGKKLNLIFDCSLIFVNKGGERGCIHTCFLCNSLQVKILNYGAQLLFVWYNVLIF